MKPRTFGSLFAGIGGIDIGLERAGWESRWMIEKDPWCQKILHQHWPEVPLLGDIAPLTGEELEYVELIAGGFPCQPFSHAGRRSAEDDDRYLWPHMLRIIRRNQPHFVLAENVYGLVTSKQGLVLETVYLDLEAAGYEISPPVVFPAAAVGAPHRRDRVWICAHRGHGSRSTGEDIEQGEWPEDATGLRSQGRQALAYPSSEGHEDRAGRALPGLPDDAQTNSRTERCCGSCGERNVADTLREGLPIGLEPEELRGNLREEGTASPESRGRTTEPELGRSIDGVPEGLDVAGYLSAWEEGWEEDIPRVVPSKMLGRVNRIRGLGNAVVPQCAEVIGRALWESCDGL